LKKKLIIGLSGAGHAMLKYCDDNPECDLLYIDQPGDISNQDFPTLALASRDLIGDQAPVCEDTQQRITHTLCQYEQVILVGGLGGKTASSLLFEISTITKQQNISTHCIIFIPLSVEKIRRNNALTQLKSLLTADVSIETIDLDEIAEMAIGKPLVRILKKADSLAAMLAHSAIYQESDGYSLDDYRSVKLISKITEVFPFKGTVVTNSHVEGVSEIKARYELHIEARAHNFFQNFNFSILFHSSDDKHLTQLYNVFEKYRRSGENLLMHARLYDLIEGELTVYDPELIPVGFKYQHELSE